MHTSKPRGTKVGLQTEPTKFTSTLQSSKNYGDGEMLLKQKPFKTRTFISTFTLASYDYQRQYQAATQAAKTT